MAMTGSARKVIKGGCSSPEGNKYPREKERKEASQRNQYSEAKKFPGTLVVGTLVSRTTQYRATRQDLAQEMERS